VDTRIQYTRYRRWTRVACLIETVEIVPTPFPASPSELSTGIVPSPTIVDLAPVPSLAPQPAVIPAPLPPKIDITAAPASEQAPPLPQKEPIMTLREKEKDFDDDEPGAALRKRLKAAIKGH
jgi:hypothetical protein